MTVTSTSFTSDYSNILAEAAAAFRDRSVKRPSAATVVAALLTAEKATKQARSTIPVEALAGRWRLWFFTGTRKVKRGGIALGRGIYAPQLAPAQISFDQQGTIENQVQLGALKLRLIGPTRYLGKKNLLAFDFIRLQVLVGQRSVIDRPIRSGKNPARSFEQQPISQLPFFAFFLATENYIAARGRGGGLAIWVRERNS